MNDPEGVPKLRAQIAPEPKEAARHRLMVGVPQAASEGLPLRMQRRIGSALPRPSWPERETAALAGGG
jgi:hypothetical protein